MKLDVLVFTAHPDDAELSCGGTILSLEQAGKKVGVVDFTRGEMGTRGTPEIRDAEAAASSEILKLSVIVRIFCSRKFAVENSSLPILIDPEPSLIFT